MVENPGSASSWMEFWSLHNLEGLWFVALERTTMRISIARTQLDRRDLQNEVLQPRTAKIPVFYSVWLRINTHGKSRGFAINPQMPLNLFHYAAVYFLP